VRSASSVRTAGHVRRRPRANNATHNQTSSTTRPWALSLRSSSKHGSSRLKPPARSCTAVLQPVQRDRTSCSSSSADKPCFQAATLQDPAGRLKVCVIRFTCCSIPVQQQQQQVLHVGSSQAAAAPWQWPPQCLQRTLRLARDLDNDLIYECFCVESSARQTSGSDNAPVLFGNSCSHPTSTKVAF
jgi:hypothetical protein